MRLEKRESAQASADNQKGGRSVRARIPKVSDLELLSRLNDLSCLSKPQLKNIHDAMSTAFVRNKGIVFEECDAPSVDIHILLSGSAELSYVKGDRRQIVAILSPGMIFRMPLMTAEVGYGFQCAALEDCRVARLPIDRFFTIALGVPVADYTIMTGLYGGRRFGGLLARYPCFLGLRLRQRVAAALLELAHEFGVRDNRAVLIRIPLSQRQIAGLVGASRPKVGRVLMDLEHQDAIVRKGRRVAVVVRTLEAIVGSTTQS